MSGPTPEPLGDDSDHDSSTREESRQSSPKSKGRDQPHEDGDKHDPSTDGAKNSLSVLGTGVEDRDDESIGSWEKRSVKSSRPSTPLALPVRQLGLSRRTGWTDFNDYDVVTVHGARDDHQTAWTDRNDNSVIDDMFTGLSVRQLDYVYDTGNSAHIYDPSADGITVEANALLKSLAQNRAELPITEKYRPIIWVCHDLGGSIVKQALISAIHSEPDLESPVEPELQEDPDHSMSIRKIYKRLPLLTTAIIFLACPHGNESKEELEDQLFSLLQLPGPLVRTQTLQKITNLSRQIEKINLDFLETNVMDCANILNFTGQERNETQTNAARIPQTAAQDSNTDSQAAKSTCDFTTTPHRIFPVHKSAMLHVLGLYYTLPLMKTGHLDLVRGADPSEVWDRSPFFSKEWNLVFGFDLVVIAKYLPYQNSLLSLLPPTRVTKYQFYVDGFERPALMSWIMEHEVLENQLCEKRGARTVYLHAGSSRAQAIDMKTVSQRLYVAYDLVKSEKRRTSPCLGCFYFEFDRHDSRRAGLKAMIVSFLCTYECRMSPYDNSSHARSIDNWSLKHMISVFLEVQKTDDMKGITIILGRIDQCDEKERSIFLEAILERQNANDVSFNLLVTTTRPDEFLCGILPPGSIISLDDCSLSLSDYLEYPGESAIEERIQRLIARRPEFAHSGPQLPQIFGKFREERSLQETVLEWLSSYKYGSSTDEVTDMVQKVSIAPHQQLLNAAIEPLSAEKQRIMTHVYGWVKYASEPLTWEILAEAIRYSLPQDMARLHYIESHGGFSRFVEKVMRGIIVQDGSDLRFSDDCFYHVQVISEDCDEQDGMYRSHAGIASTCLRYLLGTEGQEMLTYLSVEKQGMDDLSWSPIVLPRHSLVSYALRFWTAHYRAAGDYRPIELATELLQNISKRSAWTEAVYVVSNPFTRIQREYISPLPYMAMFGLDDLVLKHIEHGMGQNGQNRDHWLAITEASRSGHVTTVMLLLEHTDIDAAGLQDALHWAAINGQEEALDCLVPKAQQLEDFKWPPNILEHAVVAGLENVVLALVQAGYDLNEEDSTGSCRAAHLAVQYGRDHLLKVLLDSGRADIQLQNDAGQSPLELATQTGTATSIRHLLDAGASLEVENMGKILHDTITSGNHKSLKTLIDAKVYSIDLLTNLYESDSPLSLAAGLGFFECTRVLLDNGVDPNGTSENGSALYQAIANGPFFEICKMLLEKGADPNEATHSPPNGAVLLIKGIESGNKLLVKMLLDYGAKINITDPNREGYDTPLACAIENSHYDIMEWLLERGADPNLVCEGKPDGLESVAPLYAASCLNSEARFTKALIKHGANIDWTRSGGQWTTWHAAYGSVDTMSLLLENGADINATNVDNTTALMFAVDNKTKKSVEFLLKQTNPKADLEVIQHGDPTTTALHIACSEDYNADILKLLLEAGADVNSPRSDGDSPLNLLLCFNAKDCEVGVEMILKRRPNLELPNSRGDTVLHFIGSATPLSVVMRLVEEGAPVNTTNQRGFTPLASMIDAGNTIAARYLTTVKGVDCKVYHPDFGSILLMAAAKSTLEVVRQLVRAGAEHDVVDPEFGESVLYSAIGNENRKECRKITRYLVEELGVDVNAVSGKWVCPLLRVVCEERENSMLKYLLRHGALVDQADTLGRKAVHWAAIRRNLDHLKTLVESGADISATDNFGRTPLHFAASQKTTETVRYILEKLPSTVANINIADVDGWTPLMWACKGDYGQYIAFLLVDEYKADIKVRSKDSQWSPIKLSHFYYSYWNDLDQLVERAEAAGAEKSLLLEDRMITQGMDRGWICDGCLTCRGQTSICPKCTKYLCFKCIPHSEAMHDPEHKVVDLDEFEKDNEGPNGNDDLSVHGGEGQGGSGKEEESDSESEEEDDDEEEDTD